MTNAVRDDAVRPFQVDALDIRGRAIQMGPALDDILARHDYPAPVSRLLGEAVVLTVLLGSSLKFDGQFILQAQTDGPVHLLVVDYRTAGHLRAYAGFKPEAVAEATASGEDSSEKLLGQGILAMTVDQGPHTSRYQGVVALDRGKLEEAAHSYFAQSEQIPTRVRLAVAEMMSRPDGGSLRRSWRAGGLIAQFLPAAPERMRVADLPGGDAPAGTAPDEVTEDDAWVEARSLVATIEDHELLDPEIPVDRLLYRLFHERGVRVFDAADVSSKCSCSRERIEGMLRTFSAEEIAASTEDGAISVKCEFCGKDYRFDPAAFPGRVN